MDSILKTIEIQLLGGDSSGIRISKITTELAQVIEVPRRLWQKFLELDQARQPVVYFLISTPDDDSKPDLYIGQTRDLKSRFRTHLENEFWDRAIVLLDSSNRISETETKFLEWHCLQSAVEAGDFNVVNGNGGSKPHTTGIVEAFCMNIFGSGRLLLDTLGYRLFGRSNDAQSRSEVEVAKLFYNTYSGADGRGKLTSDGFLVLEGSSGRKDVRPSSKGKSLERLRAKLIEAGVLREEGERIVFTQDYLFKSPSGAGCVLLGRNTNGRLTWKTKDGKTFEDVIPPS